MELIDLKDVGIIIALVVGLTQVIKATGLIPKRFIPVSACVLGIGIVGLGFGFTGMNILAGIMFALMSMGMWSGIKTTATAQ